MVPPQLLSEPSFFASSTFGLQTIISAGSGLVFFAGIGIGVGTGAGVAVADCVALQLPTDPQF